MTAPRNVHRLVAIGDIHLRPGPKQIDVLAALDQILAAELGGPDSYFLPNVAGWLLLGDLFHTRSTIEDRNAIAPRLQRMASVAPVIIIAGNHDAPGDLDVFGRLHAEWPIHVVTSPRTVLLVLPDDSTIAVFCLPYPMKAGLVAAGIAHGDLNLEAGNALDAIFMKAADELHAAAGAGRPTLMIGHASIAGAIASNGQPQIGAEIAIDRAMLARLGGVPKIFGHIHKAQEIADAVYAGSICRLDFGETEEKRYLSVACIPASGGYWCYDIASHRLDVAPMYHVDGHLTRDAFTWTVTKGPGGEQEVLPRCSCTEPVVGSWVDSGGDRTIPYRFSNTITALTACPICQGTGISWRGCEVRVRYRYPQSEKAALSKAQILAIFAEAKRLELEPIAVPDRALRAPEVAAATTLHDKFIAYCALGGSPASEGTLDKLAVLEHKDAAQVLLLVASTVAQIETPQEETVLA